MAACNRIEIKKTKLLLAEGRDAKYFFIWACEAYRITGIQVLDFGGVDSLHGYLQNLPKLPGYEIVETIVIVRDAENAPNDAIRSIKGSLKNAGLPVPPKAFTFTKRLPRVAYMLFPGFVSSEEDTLLSGNLETLCMSMVKGDSVLQCADQYMQCLQSIKQQVEHPHKTRLYTYLAGKNFAGLKIGEAAKAGAWNWECSQIEPYKRIIMSM
jgi:hypothetical protein